MMKFAIFCLVVVVARPVLSYRLNMTIISHGSDNVDEVSYSESRGIDKGFNLIYNLYKMFRSNGELTSTTPKYEIVPLDGVYSDGYYNSRVDTIDKFPTLADLNKQDEKEMMMMNGMMETAVKKEEPQYWLFDKFSKKVDLVLLTKILLKIIIFKKVVKFIALVCLLFFIPAIKDDSAKEERNLENLDIYDQIDYRTKEILTFAVTVIEAFSTDTMVWCVAGHDAFCRFQSMFDRVDQSYTVDSIIGNWYPRSSPIILKYLDKLALPKPEIPKPEAYLTLPEDEIEYPIAVSDDDEDLQNSHEENEDDQASNDSQVDGNVLESEEDEEL